MRLIQISEIRFINSDSVEEIYIEGSMMRIRRREGFCETIYFYEPGGARKATEELRRLIEYLTERGGDVHEIHTQTP